MRRDDSAATKTLAEHAYSLLREDILWGRLAPAEKLKIQMLKERYDLSAGPLREAMNRLSAEFLIEQESQKGFRVSPISSKTAEDVGNLRFLIEAEAIRRSIDKGNEEWENSVILSYFHLEKTESCAENSQEMMEKWEKNNKLFHHALISGCDSKITIQIHGIIYSHHERFLRLSRMENFLSRDVNVEHKQIMNAAIDRDADRAIILLQQHIQKTTKTFLK